MQSAALLSHFCYNYKTKVDKIYRLCYIIAMKKFKSIFLILISLIVALSFSSCSSNKEPEIFTIAYLAGEGGRVRGEQVQMIDKGADAETVTAVPKDGYEFIGWSDGVETAERTDRNIQADFEVVANFSLTSKLYTLNYKFGTAEKMPKTVRFSVDKFEQISFPVPEREHFTFGGWYCGTTKIADADGNMVIGKDLLSCSETDIYAIWIANETFTYKILLVDVTEIDAELKTAKNKTIKVDYKMGEVERKICEQTTIYFREAVNAMMDGLVNFEVDEYYTKETVTTDEFSQYVENKKMESYINYEKTKEMQEIYDKYYSVLTIFNMEDYDGQLHLCAGSGSTKFAIIHAESQLYLGGYDMEELLNPEFEGWKKDWTGNIYHMLHEFTHTLEQRFGSLDFERDYHTASNFILNSLRSSVTFVDEAQALATKYFLLHEIVLNGEKVGIPYEFWQKMHGKEYDHPLVWD